MASVDPRAYSEFPLDAPHPLPFVSRKALRRVKNPLPAPDNCRYCGPSTPVFIGHHAEVYNGRSYGEWPYVYLCESCGAYVGLHPFTDIPLGTLADAQLRDARKKHKTVFHEVMQAAGMDRRQAYRWLAGELGIQVGACHWGWFEIEDCVKAGAICQARLEELSYGRC